MNLFLTNGQILSQLSTSKSVLSSDAVAAAFITALASILAVLISVHAGKSKKNAEIEKLKLSNHPFFTRMDALKNSIYNGFTLKNKGKEAVFKDILWNHISILQENLLVFANKIQEAGEISNADFYNASMTAFNEMIEKQTNYYMSEPGYTREDKEVLSIVISKFNSWNTENMNNIQTTLELVSNSCFYNTSISKAGAVLDFYTGMSVHIINCASDTLKGINGDLAGLMFKGIKI
jgi:hypothetical protein